MLRLSQVIKPWKESAALNSHINLYGFWNQTAFLTKSGDLGIAESGHPRIPGTQPDGSSLRAGCRGDALAAGHQDIPADD